MTEKQIELYMKNLRLSREDAILAIKEDEAIDKMTSTKEINADLTPEQRKAVKKMTNTGTKTAKTTTKTVRKPKIDVEKEEIIKKFAEFIEKTYKNAEIVNKNREIAFSVGENSYSITLTKHRNK